MRHFNYFPNGGPFPGTCAMCGINRDLWQLGFDHPLGGDAMACTVCIGELGDNIGYAPKQPLIEIIESLRNQVDELSSKLNTVPDLTEGFINAVRNNLTDFVFSVSSIAHSASEVSNQHNERNDQPDAPSIGATERHSEAPSESAEYKRPSSVSASSSRNKPGRPSKS